MRFRNKIYIRKALYNNGSRPKILPNQYSHIVWRQKMIRQFIEFKRNDIATVKNAKNNSETNTVTDLACSNNNDRILVIIACHTNNIHRFNAFKSILNYLDAVENIDIVIVNSTNLPFSNIIKSFFRKKYMAYYEIPNDQFYGFSKWYYGLLETNYMNYKFTTFMNDSIMIHGDISHFFDYTRVKDLELFAYNDSTEIKPHYQSYLFSIKNTSIQNFFKMFNDNKLFIKSYGDVIHFYELSLFDYFQTHDCFLKIANFPSQIGKNIFFSNDFLYNPLLRSGILPFTKLKRMCQ
jgi:hypothetical protein